MTQHRPPVAPLDPDVMVVGLIVLTLLVAWRAFQQVPIKPPQVVALGVSDRTQAVALLASLMAGALP